MPVAMRARKASRELRRSRNLRAIAPVAFSAVCLLLPANISAWRQPAPTSQSSKPRPALDFSGSVAARDAGRLRLKTDLGNIVIHTHDAPTVDYRVHLETDPSSKEASRLLKNFAIQAQATDDGVMMRGTSSAPSLAGRLWVTIDLTMPRNYSLDVTTGVGSITTDDLVGRQMLLTQGGNITTGNINGSARLTAVAGGHITVKNVSGELIAETGGGHITTGTIGSDATLHTHGGHIRSDSIAGTAHLSTDGGNIALEHAGADLVAETAGGQIQVGEAAGLVRAKTAGGGIRVVRSSGPANLQTADGSIYLTQADAAVKASTATGGITAWIMSPSKDSGQCELDSTNGDIVVHLSRKVPVTIDAQVQMGQTHGFEIDPAFPIAVHYDDTSRGERVARAAGALNGGGEVVRIRTISGNIRFVLSDVDEQMLMYRRQMEGLQKQMDDLLKSAFPQTQQ
jgi:DUF4097 and DUF4098 domain-containing protein YvlB